MFNLKVLFEAAVAGLVSIIIGYLVAYLLGYVYSIDFNEEVCKTNAKNFLFAQTLFLVGFFVHMSYHLLDLNTWVYGMEARYLA